MKDWTQADYRYRICISLAVGMAAGADAEI